MKELFDLLRAYGFVLPVLLGVFIPVKVTDDGEPNDCVRCSLG